MFVSLTEKQCLHSENMAQWMIMKIKTLQWKKNYDDQNEWSISSEITLFLSNLMMWVNKVDKIIFLFGSLLNGQSANFSNSLHFENNLIKIVSNWVWLFIVNNIYLLIRNSFLNLKKNRNICSSFAAFINWNSQKFCVSNMISRCNTELLIEFVFKSWFLMNIFVWMQVKLECNK